MSKQNSKYRDELETEYKSNINNINGKIDELRVQKCNLEKCYDELYDWYFGVVKELEPLKPFIAENSSVKDAQSLDHITDNLNQEYRQARNAVEKEIERVESEEKAILRKKEEIEEQYQQDIFKIQEETKDECNNSTE